MKTVMTELLHLIKSLEKKAEKSKNEFLAFKAARDKACNSSFAIIRPRLRKQNVMNNKVPVDESEDWRFSK